ncbi:MAG: hypothetical protein LBN26_00220 [Christensenellaceae bacterium]|jgi:shikimate dehydrogenase|nr:hypothetical protein [Christensenellaceae bacterium]
MEYALIGHPLSHSHSKKVHGLLGDYAYDILDLPDERLDSFLKERRFKGLNVTIPYKQRVIPYCASLSATAQRIGSVNTIVVQEDGALYGDNTDYKGFLYMCRRAGVAFAGQKVIILGSGGTSLTVQAAARDEGAAQVAVVSRNGQYNYQNLSLLKGYDILINTTPVGMFPHAGQAPLALSGFSSLRAVVDVIYNPLHTRLIQSAAQLGIPCTGGLPMLVAQAAYAAELFLGKPLGDAAIGSALAQLRRELANIVLIGMPGCGKSTIGAQLARSLGRAHIDTDAEIEAQAGMSAADIIQAKGEQAFRQLEAEAVARAGRLSGTVISTGGGAILLEENRLALRQNGFVAWVQRPLPLLETKGRPLSLSGAALQGLYEEREAWYQACCDHIIKNDGAIPHAAKQVEEAFYEAVGD